MFGSQILDVVIGIVFVFLLLSLVCSAINEFISSLLRLRARDLEDGIRLLLSDPGLANQFYQHPLIKSIHQAKKRPPYIPSRTFALVMMDIVAPASDGPNRFRQMRDGISKSMPDGSVKRTLLLLADEARNDIDQTRESVENWFNNAMDRVAGKYKQRTQYILFVLGLLVAGFLNVDTIIVGQRLWTDQALRDALVSKAQAAAQQPLPQASPLPSPGSSGGHITELLAQIKQIRDKDADIQALGLPIGWGEGFDPRKIPGHLPGWLITAFAISLGAPFWFDMLNKFIVVRSTVKPHEKSPEQPSKDKPAPETEAKAEESIGEKAEEPSKG